MKLSFGHAVYGSNYNRVANNSHSHLCVKCGNVWSHGHDKRGCREAHTCTKCGEILNGQWPQLTPQYLCELIKRGAVKI